MISKDAFKRLDISSLYLLITDAEKRIMSNSEDKNYVKQQREFINKCEETIDAKKEDMAHENKLAGMTIEQLFKKYWYFMDKGLIIKADEILMYVKENFEKR